MIRKLITSVALAGLFLPPAFCFQDDLASRLQDGLSAYYQNSSTTKLHIQFNQPRYHAGDTAYFKVSLLNATGETLLSGKFVVRILLILEGKEVVFQNRTFIQNGRGQSQLILPVKFSPGVYTLRAFIEDRDVAKSAKFEYPFIVAAKKTSEIQTEQSIKVYPEGGSFVDGILNSALVTGLNSGDSISLIDNLGQKVQEVKATNGGLAKLKFRYDHNHEYHLVTRHARIPLSIGGEKTASLVVTEDADKLTVTIGLKERSSGSLFLTVNNQDRVIQVIPVSSEVSEHSVAKYKCGTGLCQFTLMDGDGNVRGERMWYIAPEKPSFQIVLENENFKRRDQIKMEVILTENTPRAWATTAVTVYKSDLFPPTNLSVKLWMAELEIPSIDVGLLTEEEVNDFLIAATWKKFMWSKIVKHQAEKTSPSFPIYFSGVVMEDSRVSEKDSLRITFWLKNHDFVYDLSTRQNGRFDFPLFMNFSDDEILYAVTHKGIIISDAELLLDSFPASGTIKRMPYHSSEKDDAYYHFSKLRSAVLKSYSYYEGKERPVPRDDTAVESIPPDFSVNMEKFKPFVSVAEMFNEVVPLVRARKVKENYEIRVFLKEDAMHASESPLVMIDGEITDTEESLLAMNPASIKKIGVLNSRNKLVPYGALGKYGIIVVETTLQEKQVLKNKHSVWVKGIDAPVDFSVLNLANRQTGRTPYLRSTLFWDGSLELKNRESQVVTFYASDDVGEYDIVVTGFTDKGVPFEVKKRVTVGLN